MEKNTDGNSGVKNDEEFKIPPEIDVHLKLFGKEPWEVEYGEVCPECQSRTDEFGFCTCGAGGE